MQDEAVIRVVRVVVRVIDAVGVEEGAAPLDAVCLVALLTGTVPRGSLMSCQA